MAFKAKLGKNNHRSRTVKEAIVEAVKDEMVGLNINISKRKRAAFKAKAALQGDNMVDVILEAVDRYIEN